MPGTSRDLWGIQAKAIKNELRARARDTKAREDRRARGWPSALKPPVPVRSEVCRQAFKSRLSQLLRCPNSANRRKSCLPRPVRRQQTRNWRGWSVPRFLFSLTVRPESRTWSQRVMSAMRIAHIPERMRPRHRRNQVEQWSESLGRRGRFSPTTTESIPAAATSVNATSRPTFAFIIREQFATCSDPTGHLGIAHCSRAYGSWTVPHDPRRPKTSRGRSPVQNSDLTDVPYMPEYGSHARVFQSKSLILFTRFRSFPAEYGQVRTQG